MVNFITNILPTVLGLLDKVPFKGFRALVSGVGLTVISYLGMTGKMDPATATVIGGILATSMGYFSAQH